MEWKPYENCALSKKIILSCPFHLSIYIEKLVSYKKVQNIKLTITIILEVSIICMLMCLTQAWNINQVILC